MKTLLKSLAFASALILTGTAQAADLDADIAASDLGGLTPGFAVSLFGGANFSPHSNVDYSIPGVGTGSVSPGWDGASFEMPPYYGVRATYWLDMNPAFGLSLEFTHAKVKADPVPAPFTTLEFTDGINFLTLNGIYRHDLGTALTPYVGVGAGLSIPHVEVSAPGTPDTREYQITGAAVQAFVGADYRITQNWSAFAEYKFSYGQVDADLQAGGSLETDIISNQFILGITYTLN